MVDEKKGPSKKDYLSKLSAAERDELLGTISAAPPLDVEVAVPGYDHFKVKTDEIKGSVLQLPSELVPSGMKPGAAAASFVINLSKYLIKSVLQQTADGSWILDFQGDIFLVQRRKNFRVDVPPEIVYKASVCPIDEPEQPFKAKVLNISLGGCSLEVDAAEKGFQVEAQVRVTMNVEGGQVISLNSVVKRITQVADKENKCFFGIEFDKLNSFEESRVNEVVMKCYRLINQLHS